MRVEKPRRPTPMRLVPWTKCPIKGKAFGRLLRHEAVGHFNCALLAIAIDGPGATQTPTNNPQSRRTKRLYAYSILRRTSFDRLQFPSYSVVAPARKHAPFPCSAHNLHSTSVQLHQRALLFKRRVPLFGPESSFLRHLI